MPKVTFTVHVGKSEVEGYAGGLLFHKFKPCPNKHGKFMKSFQWENDRCEFFRTSSGCYMENQRDTINT